ncbi:mitochondrial ribosomal small subunit component [Thecaphora frezii]
MPRRLPTQVPQTVSRLLDAGFLKKPPVWFEAVNNHPPAPTPPRYPIARPDEDLPVSLRSTRQPAAPSAASSSSVRTAVVDASPAKHHHRDINNSKKKVRALGPKLAPKPILYDEDKLRQQFFRDHPWEAYRPKTLVEMSDKIGSEPRFSGDPKRLRSYGHNPSVEDFIACTLAAHRQGGLSLSQAYHNTLSSFYAIKAEQEHARRYAILEAKYYGANLGRSETQRGFEKEEKALESWAAWASGDLQAANAPEAATAEAQQAKAPRVKRTDDTFTAGEQYLEAAKAFREGRLNLSGLDTGAAATSSSTPVAAASNAAPAKAESNGADDFLGLRRTAIRSSEIGPDEAEALDASVNDADVISPKDTQRFAKRVGTRGQRI